MTHYLDTLSEFAATLDFAALPASLQQQAHYVVADTFGAIAAGSAEPELQQFAEHFAKESGPASLIGLGRKTSADCAAMVNGAAGTFLEMDEGNRFARGHPSIHVLPAALAYAEQHNATGAEFMAAIVVGYEVGARLGIASNLRGSMHPHGTWGTVGAAAAVARLARFDAAQMREAINVASSLTLASSKRTMLEGGLVRNLYAGVSNQMGLLALTLVQSGIGGERDGLASVFGEVVSEQFDPNQMIAELGTRWEIDRNYFKLHSCCRYNHGTLDALDRLFAKHGTPKPDEIRRIKVTSYRYAAELNDTAPRNTLAAKFSVPFAVATRIVNGTSRLSSFTWDAVRDPNVAALAQRVEVSEDPAMTARLPLERPARVEMLFADGRSWSEEVGTNRGDDADPYTRAELDAKFLDLTTRVWSMEKARTIQQQLHELSKQASLTALTRSIQ